VSWTPPSVSNTLSKCHKTIPRRASGLVQIANAHFQTVWTWKRALACYQQLRTLGRIACVKPTYQGECA
jgi:hypothetical protein